MTRAGKLSLRARLLVGTGCALALTSALLFYTIVRLDFDRASGLLDERLAAEMDLLVPAVAEQAVIGDYAFILQMLRSRAEQSTILQVTWTDEAGRELKARSASVKPRAPAWFARWGALPDRVLSRNVVVGGRTYGALAVEADHTDAVNHVWDDAVHLLQFLVLGVGLMFATILAILRNAMGPLDALARGAARFGAGDYSARIAPGGPPEVRGSIGAFNRMAEDIESLVTTLNASRAAIFEEKERAQVTLASIADAVVSADLRGTIDYLNPVAEKLTGWSAAQALGRPLAEVYRTATESDGQAVLVARDGSRHPIEQTAAPIRGRTGGVLGQVVVFRDVGESRRMARQLSWQATHDSLTGLANRAEFERRLKDLVARASADGSRNALLYLDLDQFKVVNDTCGHVGGDELLRQVSALLARGIRDSDTLARLGGDEFGILLSGCPMDRALGIAEALRGAVAQLRFAWQDKAFVVAISIGAVEVRGGEDAGRLLAAADAACYSAKDNGRNRVQAYLPGDTELAARQGEMQWISRITRALEEDRIVLHAQHIRPAQPAPGAQAHFEILVRMIDEQGQLTPPMAFIPAAERYNLMPALDRRVIALTFEAARRIARAARCPLLSINVSGASLNDDGFLGYVREQFAAATAGGEAGLRAGDFCFEITETAAIANLTRATRVMSELRAMGFRFSLDDFGSGLSSFAYLKNLPVEFLKIDGSFVKDMATDPIDRAMVKAIHELGHVMGIATIAEWVDGDETLGMLRLMGVDYVQGYGVGKPFPLEELYRPQAVRLAG